jgi:hypothetical protein
LDQEKIREKGFNLYGRPGVDEYGKIKVGPKQLDNAILTIDNTLKKDYPKPVILKALADKDLATIRDISEFYYNTNGIYARQCKYFAYLFRYDWYIVPEVYQGQEADTDKIIKDFYKILNYLDGSNIKKMCGDIALETIKTGAYYGYIIDSKSGLQV